MTDIVIHWFRQDLRLADNPALCEASRIGEVLPIYILDHGSAGEHKMGGASLWWLYHALKSLDKSLGGKLSIYEGNPQEILETLNDRYSIKAVTWNRCYEPWRIQRDKEVKSFLKNKGVEVISCNGSLLWEPWEVLKSDQTPYKVFTPYYRKGCLNSGVPRKPLSKPKSLKLFEDTENKTLLDDLKLLPKIPWDKKMIPYWKIGEDGAQKCLNKFLKVGIQNYKEGRNFPAKEYVSRLSPYLHFGEISPNQIWNKTKALRDDNNVDHFCSELGWREFSYSLLYYNPDLPRKNLQEKFDKFPWVEDEGKLKAWQRGLTGYPIVDAGMRELWETGYMHNRVRMIVGSFLVKNLRLHWVHGEKWFWDCLVDADLANNSASWQWIAGCGADAAPYFRIFNPVTQGQKFDPEGVYTRLYIPELKKLPDKYLFSPWEAPAPVLEYAGVELGKNYPKPIVDLKVSREAALDAFKSLKENGK